MKLKKLLFCVLGLFIVFHVSELTAQITPGLYISDISNVRHELKINNNYIVHSVYEQSPANFIKTYGGFYRTKNGVLNIQLEFNSDYEKDGLKELHIPFALEGDQLILKTDSELIFHHMESMGQDLDGAWLFATRGPDTGQDRRGEGNSRKTLKFLLDNRFQWIAYQTETMKFSGTGGGFYSSEKGIYTEKIEYFSRDNSRVGASLEFDYEIKGSDWHHRGKNSKGEPMYEIWERRTKNNH